jgi:hypothetical protein
MTHRLALLVEIKSVGGRFQRMGTLITDTALSLTREPAIGGDKSSRAASLTRLQRKTILVTAEHATATDPVSSIYIVTDPVSSIDILTDPVGSIDIVTDPVGSIDIVTDPVNSIDIVTNPISSIDIVTSPFLIGFQTRQTPKLPKEGDGFIFRE